MCLLLWRFVYFSGYLFYKLHRKRGEMKKFKLYVVVSNYIKETPYPEMEINRDKVIKFLMDWNRQGKLNLLIEEFKKEFPTECVKRNKKQ